MFGLSAAQFRGARTNLEKGLFAGALESPCEPVPKTVDPLVSIAGHVQPFGFTAGQIANIFLSGFSLTTGRVLSADNIALLKTSAIGIKMVVAHRLPVKPGRHRRMPHQRGENNGGHKNYYQNNERDEAAATSACYMTIFVFPHRCLSK